MAASKKIIPVLVDCNWGKRHKDISTKYGIRGYPTVIFTDHLGAEVSRMKGRTAESITKQIEELAKEHTVAVWIQPWEKALAKAKKEKKPLAIILVSTEKFDAWDEVRQWLKEELKKDIEGFVWGLSEPGTKEREVLERMLPEKKRLNALLIVDPREKEPFKAPLADTGSVPLQKMIPHLKKALKGWKAAEK